MTDLRRLAARRGYTGRRAAARLAEGLRRHDVVVTRQAVGHWLEGQRVPELASLIGLLDLLRVLGDERRAVIERLHPAVRRIALEEDELSTVVDPTPTPEEAL